MDNDGTDPFGDHIGAYWEREVLEPRDVIDGESIEDLNARWAKEYPQ